MRRDTGRKILRQAMHRFPTRLEKEGKRRTDGTIRFPTRAATVAAHRNAPRAHREQRTLQERAATHFGR
jgi:hypothetical protein